MEPAAPAGRTLRRFSPELALVAVTVTYGATFTITQDALHDVTPVGLIALRFAFGAAALGPFALRRGWRLRGATGGRRRDFMIAVAAFGIVGFAGFVLQNAGLQYTTTSNSAFITGLFVVFTTLIETVVTRRRPPPNVLVAVALAVVGLYLLSDASLAFGRGEFLTLGCAFMFGLWIFLGGRYAHRFDPVALTAAQLVVFVGLALPLLPAAGLGDVTARVLAAAALTGVLASAGAFSAQLWAQRFVEPTRAAVILEFEPVVAGVIGYAIGERLGWVGYLGALVILAGMFVAEAPFLKRR